MTQPAHLARLLALFFLVAAKVAGAAPASAATPVSPSPKGSPGDWVNPDDYPAAALRAGIEGRTTFRLSLDATGKPVACTIHQSSGSDLLDNFTCRLLVERARFNPARDANGRPAPSGYTNSVAWKIPQDKLPLPDSVQMALRFAVGADGKLKDCNVLRETPAGPELSPAPCKFASLFMLQDAEPANWGPQPTAYDTMLMISFAPQPPAAQTAAPAGYTRRELVIWAITLHEGEIIHCKPLEQRGEPKLLDLRCKDLTGFTLDPPFASIDQNGFAHGFLIRRLSEKNP